jgi:hypothetical protein
MLKLEVVDLYTRVTRTIQRLNNMSNAHYLISFEPRRFGDWNAHLYEAQATINSVNVLTSGKDPFEALKNLELLLDTKIQEGQVF